MLAKRQDHLAESSDNQLAVKHPLDCGSHCLMCHGEKFLAPRRAREKRAAAKLVAEAMQLPFYEVR